MARPAIQCHLTTGTLQYSACTQRCSSGEESPTEREEVDDGNSREFESPGPGVPPRKVESEDADEGNKRPSNACSNK